jgi:chromosome segregation ATPase
VGNVYPLGIGFTLKPAANVEGVVSNEFEEKENKNEINLKPKTNEAAALQKVSDKISQNLKKTVNNIKTMDLETLLSQIKTSLDEKKFNKEAVAGMTSQFAEAIKQKDEEYKASLEAAQNEKAEIAKANDELVASVESVKEELKIAQERISSFEAAKASVEAEERFNARMEEIDSIYDLDETDASFIADKIKGLDDSEEAFASLKTELEVFWASKNKEAKSKYEEEIKARVEEEVQKRLSESQASTEVAEEEVNVEEALDSAEQTDVEIPNNNEAQASQTETLREKFAKAFSRDNILS